MKTETLIAKAALFYLLAMLTCIFFSWGCCGCVLTCIACYYLVRAMWKELKGMLTDLQNMKND